MGRELRRVPVWVWLTAIVAGSAAVRALLGRGMVAPFIMVDEVIWSEIARGIADAGEPLLRDEPDPGYSIVYPLLLSPVYALFESLPDAYAAVKTLNAIVMSLAAIPTYLLARRVMREGLALLSALMAVAIPSFAYTGTVMTENVFYPLFLVVALVLVLVLERPTWPRVLLLLALIGLAFATRVQAVALVPAVLLAPLVLAIFEQWNVLRPIARFRRLYLAAAGAAAVVLAAQFATGRSPEDLLGAYSPVGEKSYEVGEALRFLWWHVAEFSLYLLVIPLAATVVLLGRVRSLDSTLRELLAVTVSLTVCLLPVVAVFASEFSDRIQERNLFYLAPLFCVALLAWVDRGVPRPWVLSVLAAGGAALLVLAVPFDRFITTSAVTDTLMLLPLWSLQDRIGHEWLTTAVFLLVAFLAASFLFVPKRFAVALPLIVLGLWILTIRPVWWGTHGFERASRGALFQGIRTAERDWIDRALPEGETAAFLWTGRTDRLTVNENEFFNRRVGPVYYVNQPTPGGLPERGVTIDPETGRVTLQDGSPLRDRFLVTDSSIEPGGEPLARDEGWGITLWRIDPPLVSTVRIDGLYPNDTWSGRTVTYLRRRCAPGQLAVSISSDPSLFVEQQTVVARVDGAVVGRARLEPESRVVLRVPVSPRRGADECRVVFTVTPTAIPARVTGGENPDPRVLGAHFNRFVYTPRPT